MTVAPTATRVFLATDHEALLVPLLKLLRRAGFAVTVGDSASHTNGLASHMDCVIAGAEPPLFKGIRLAKRLREAGRNIPVVLLSSLSPESLVIYLWGLGNVYPLRHPIDFEEVLTAVKTGLASANAEGLS